MLSANGKVICVSMNLVPVPLSLFHTKSCQKGNIAPVKTKPSKDCSECLRQNYQKIKKQKMIKVMQIM